MWYRKVFKLGGSLNVCIPAPLCRELNLYDGDYMRISLKNETVLIEKDKGPETMRLVLAKNKRLKGEV